MSSPENNPIAPVSAEVDAAPIATRRLITASTLIADFEALGLRAGQIVLMHSSLKALDGYVIGGAPTVLDALLKILTPAGTLVTPAFTGDNSEPSYWQHPPVPAAWWDTIRAEWPPYRPAISVTRQMGLIAESFRTYPGVMRSAHPAVSFAAWGAEAKAITADHALDYCLGEESPLARLYARDGYVLLLGVGHGNNTSLHLAEYRSEWPGKDQLESQSSAMLDESGARVRVAYTDLPNDDDMFPDLGTDYEVQTGAVTIGMVAGATARFMRQRPIVDYAVGWLTEHRAVR